LTTPGLTEQFIRQATLTCDDVNKQPQPSEDCGTAFIKEVIGKELEPPGNRSDTSPNDLPIDKGESHDKHKHPTNNPPDGGDDGDNGNGPDGDDDNSNSSDAHCN